MARDAGDSDGNKGLGRYLTAALLVIFVIVVFVYTIVSRM